MPVGELYEATDLLAWLASGKWPYDRPDYLYRWRDRSWRFSMVIAKIFLQNEWFYSAIKPTPHVIYALSQAVDIRS